MSGLVSIRREPRSLYPAPVRPRTRGECIDGIRPCPFFGCRHHLDSDEHDAGQGPRVDPNKLNEHRPSCSLDIADRGQVMDLDEIRVVTGLHHNAAEAAFHSGLAKLREHPAIKVTQGREWCAWPREGSGLESFFSDLENREQMHPLADAQRWADAALDVDE